MFNNFIKNVKTKINIIKETNINYNKLIKKSMKFSGFKPLPELTNEPCEGRINYITNICPDINNDKATIISKIIPIDETYLTIIYSKEIITNINYWLIPTNKYLWIINNQVYGILPYNNITICNILKNNIMSNTINLNNIILEVNGTDKNINNFINILSNVNERNKIIKEKTSYLCNITPIYQQINNNNCGISIDKNNNIVFHIKNDNFKYNYQELINYELLIDNITTMKKNKQNNNHITTFKNNCYSISIRITTENNTFTMPILEPNMMGTKYTPQSSQYIKSIKFAKEIINKLNELDKNKY